MTLFKWACLFGLFVQPTLINCRIGRAFCFPRSDSVVGFRFEFRFKREMETTITGLRFFPSNITSPPLEQSINTAECTETSMDSNGLFRVGFSVNGSASPLPCGISRMSDSYTVTVALLGVNQGYRFTCDTGPGGNINNFPDTLDITTFETGNVENRLNVAVNPYSVKFQVLQPDDQLAKVMILGQYGKLRLILDKGPPENVPDSWGYVFHIPFLDVLSSNTPILLHIATRGPGTKVKVTGSLAGAEFVNQFQVTRDQHVTVTVPSAYHSVVVGSSNAWVSSTRAIKVEALDDLVGMRVVQVGNFGLGSFTAVPDDVLGQKYNCYTGTENNPGGQVLVYAVQDGTDVQINFNSFSIIGLTINGAAAMSPHTLSLNENDVLHMRCESNCGVITVESTNNKPIGVLTGHGNAMVNDNDDDAGILLSQFLPVNTYGRHFVLVDNSFGWLTQFQIMLENPTSTVDVVRGDGSTVTLPSGALIDDFLPGEEISFSNGRGALLMSARGVNFYYPSSMFYPSTEQWSSQHYFYANEGATHFITVVSTVGDLAYIKYITNGIDTETGGISTAGMATLGQLPGFSPIPIQSPTSQKYEFFKIQLDIVSASGFIELKAATNNKPFMMFVFRYSSADTISLTIGHRFPTVNPCVPSPQYTSTLYGTTYRSLPGDMIDNDCDGFIDEEVNNGKDTDGRGFIDEDLAELETLANLGIHVESLLASDNPGFSTSGGGVVKILHTNGCNQRIGGILAKVFPFAHVSNLGPQYNDYFIIETPTFPMFGFVTAGTTVYFRVRYNVCVGDINGSLCENSCAAGRRKRQVDTDLSIDLAVTFEPEDQNKDVSICEMNVLLWIPCVLLMLTILVEAVMIGVFVWIKASITRR